MGIKLHGGAERLDSRAGISCDQTEISAEMIAVIGIPGIKGNGPLQACDLSSFIEQRSKKKSPREQDVEQTEHYGSADDGSFPQSRIEGYFHVVYAVQQEA